jgi:imidazolonepropionase-like amidohydrolase
VQWEAFHATVYAPAILEQAGVRVSLKSDHPVIDAHFLVWTAAIANYYGLSEEVLFTHSHHLDGNFR